MSRITEHKTITRQSEVTIARRCDGCQKRVEKATPLGWYLGIATMHQDWGNDSVDSVEEWDVCSPDCYFKIMSSFVGDNRGSRTATMDDMPVAFASRILDFLEEIEGLVPSDPKVST